MRLMADRTAAKLTATTPPSEVPPSRALRESRERFVALWGQMGTYWGVPRTMAEVHALLYITGSPTNMDALLEFLNISRGNVSMTLRSLVGWGLVSRMHSKGDRKEYFQAEQDVWKLFRTILRERKKREVEPVLDALRDCRELTVDASAAALGTDPETLKAHNQRLDDMLTFMELLDRIADGIAKPNGPGLEAAAKLLAHAC
jgi:HTH-type transcriptional regulator, glycine betaine synthesis regulator